MYAIITISFVLFIASLYIIYKNIEDKINTFFKKPQSIGIDISNDNEKKSIFVTPTKQNINKIIPEENIINNEKDIENNRSKNDRSEKDIESDRSESDSDRSTIISVNCKFNKINIDVDSDN
jgi:hypothetical protein